MIVFCCVLLFGVAVVVDTDCGVVAVDVVVICCIYVAVVGRIGFVVVVVVLLTLSFPLLLLLVMFALVLLLM